MKKEIKELITLDGQEVTRITTVDERWYAFKKGKTHEYLPSVTWITHYYPKGRGYEIWLMSHTQDEADAIRQEASERGSKVHQATEQIDAGKKVAMDARLTNPDTLEQEELTLEEYEALMSYQDWLNKTQPEVLLREAIIRGNGYAGTLDRIYRIGSQIWIVDLKTSQQTYNSHTAQISAYSHAEIDYKKLKITDKEWKARKLAILQIGYRRNGAGWKWNEVEDRYDLFKDCYNIWKAENPKTKPKQRDYPVYLQWKPKKVIKKK